MARGDRLATMAYHRLERHLEIAVQQAVILHVVILNEVWQPDLHGNINLPVDSSGRAVGRDRIALQAYAKHRSFGGEMSGDLSITRRGVVSVPRWQESVSQAANSRVSRV